MFLSQLLRHLLASVTLLGFLTPLSAVLIDFENLPGGANAFNGLKISNQYQPVGAIFSSNNGQDATIFSAPGESTSGGFIMVGADNFKDIFLNFVDPLTGNQTTVQNFTVNVVSVGHAVYTVTARNLQGNVLESVDLTNPDGAQNGFANIDSVSFSSTNIASVDFVFTTPNPGDGIGIDDLAFEFNTAVPEPASSFLLIIATAFGIFSCQRKKT